MSATKTKPILTITDNTATCDSGCAYTYWEIDRLALEEPAICMICETEVDAGWLIVDGGEVYCDNCVIDIDNTADYIAKLEAKVKWLEYRLEYNAGHRNRDRDFISKYDAAIMDFAEEMHQLHAGWWDDSGL